MKNREQITAIVIRVQKYQAQDHEERLVPTLLRWMADPVRPRTEKGRFRINPILVLLALMGLLAAGTFLFFTLVQL